MKKYPLFTFALLHGLVWAPLSLIFFKVNGFFTDPLGLLFTAAFIIGHVFLFAWLLGVLCWPWHFIGKRFAQVIGIIIGSFFSTFLITDLVVFSQYRFHIGRAMLELFFGPAGKEIFIFPLSMWCLTGVAVLVILAIEWGLWKLSTKFALSKKWVLLTLGIWLVGFFAYNGLYAWGKFMLVPSIVAQRKVLPFAYPLSVNRRLEKWGLQAPKNPYFIPSKGRINYPASPLVCQPDKNPKNILIFLIDSWRFDSFTPQIMPHLTEWAKQPNMTYFANHLSGGNGTDAGVFSLFYALPRSYWDDVTSLNLPPVLVSQLLEKGYEPAIFASAKLTSPPFYRNVFAPIANLRLESAGDSSWERDMDAVNGFEKFLANRQKNVPFFGFIFLDAPHGFSYPQEDKIFSPAKMPNYLVLTNKTDPTPYKNQYNNSVHFSDRMIDQTLHALQKYGVLDNTLVIITGDHGQELNDTHHNFWGHNGNLTDYQTKVPLLVYQAKSNKPSRVDYRTSHYDVVPTLLQDVLGCSTPVQAYSLGYNLFDSTPRPFTLFAGHNEKAIRIDNNILVLDNFGGVLQYDNHMDPISQPLPSNIVKEGLKSFRQFYK